MLNYLEELLREKTKEKKEEILYKQWQLAKDYVPNVLATISNVFPHYTLHDRTHSEAILTNIGRILGKETLEQFSSIDLWLLLCAAFYHDIGMSAFACDLDKVLKEDDFLLYLRTIQADSKHALYTQASYFEISGDKIKWKNSDVILEKIEALKFIVAEYIRYSHSERSENTLKNDHSINLPNNPIPLRLISILGKICKCHTESFEKVMELPFEEAGIEYEACHPRFIACLLRLGDLLDLDNNRISNIVLRTVKTIPEESFFHIKKHLSISRLKVDTKQIEITAECEEYKTADLASSWFSWLDKEITDQMKNWNQIVPNQMKNWNQMVTNSGFGFLPTVGNLKVELKNYDSFDGKVHQKFEIDSQKAIEMLQGAGFYKEPYQSIREILQNSVDATYFRIWIENKDNNITPEEFQEKCEKGEYAKYAIKVEIKKKSSDDKNVVWHIIISDFGLGMSKEDLQFLYKTGSSSHNKEKQKYLSEMPEWMKPSGTFGIGFQSIFLLTYKVHIRTRKYNSGDVYDIDLYNPTSDDNGIILLKTTKDCYFGIGTELSFDFKTPKVPGQITYSFGSNRVSNANIFNYDFVESESLDFKIGKIIDEISKFANTSYIKIKLKYDSKEDLIESNNIEKFEYYSKKTNLAVSINWGRKSGCSFFYRNQLVEKSPFDFHFLNVYVNILGGSAKEILTLNRNEINSQYIATLYKKTIITVFEYLKEKFSSIDDEYKPVASAFAYVYKDKYYAAYKDIYKENIDGIDDEHSEFFTEWKKYPIDIEIDGKPTKESVGYLTSNENINIIAIIKGENILRNTYKLERDSFIICTNSGFLYGDDGVLLSKVFSQLNFNYISYFGNNDKEYVLHKTDLDLINKDSWKSWFLNIYLNNLIARGNIPCNSEYMKLAIKEDCIFPYSRYTPYPKEDFSYPMMVSPYIIKYSENGKKFLKLNLSEKLIDFVFKNRKDEAVTKDEIRAIYQQFIEDRKSVIDEINNSKKTEQH